MTKAHLAGPSFSGIDTFWRAPFVSPEEVEEGHVAIVGVPNEMTLSTRSGARLGPKAIRQHSNHFIAQTRATPTCEYVTVSTGERVRVPADLELVDTGDVLLFPNDLARTSESITETLRTVTERGAFPVSLGGDHYITFPIVRGFSEGLRRVRGHERFGYIQFDAHLDSAGENLVWGRNWHGSNARLVADLPGFDKKNMAWGRAQRRDVDRRVGVRKQRRRLSSSPARRSRASGSRRRRGERSRRPPTASTPSTSR